MAGMSGESESDPKPPLAASYLAVDNSTQLVKKLDFNPQEIEIAQTFFVASRGRCSLPYT